MREISTELLDAQWSDKRIPYVELVFHSQSGGGEMDCSSRIMGIEHHEEHLGNDYATIQLNNQDHAIKQDELVGWWTEIVYGDKFFTWNSTTQKNVITGIEGHPTGRMWVKSQMDISYPGKKMVVLELADKKLEEKPCIIIELNPLAPYHYIELAGFTPFWMITMLLNHAGFGMYVLEQDDGFIDSFIPQKFVINKNSYLTGKYESFKDVIERLLAFTKCYLRKKVLGYSEYECMYEVIYPQEGGEPDEEYYSYQQPYFYEFVYRKNAVIPNRILSYCNYDYELESWDNLVIGEAKDQESINDYGEVLLPVWFPEVTLEEEANFVASSYLGRQQVASKGGRLIVPHDIRVELFDKVKVHDAR